MAQSCPIVECLLIWMGFEYQTSFQTMWPNFRTTIQKLDSLFLMFGNWITKNLNLCTFELCGFVPNGMLRHSLATLEGEKDFIDFYRALLSLECSPFSLFVGILYMLWALSFYQLKWGCGSTAPLSLMNFFMKICGIALIRGRNETSGRQNMLFGCVHYLDLSSNCVFSWLNKIANKYFWIFILEVFVMRVTPIDSHLEKSLDKNSEK